MEKGAELTPDGLYRYVLWRRWDMALPSALLIMLNPSTADADVDDPTIRRCMGFARSWCLGGSRVVNLYPFRATKPDDLWKAARPRGEGNLGWIERSVDAPGGVAIAAWGTLGKQAQVSEVRGLFYDLGVPLFALRLTANGSPSHPLYVPGDVVPVVYEPARANLKKGDSWLWAGQRS
jgi:hypothetical protein